MLLPLINRYAVLYRLAFHLKARSIILVRIVTYLTCALTRRGDFQLGSASYAKDVLRFSISSTQRSACTVAPGIADDVGKIVSDIDLCPVLQLTIKCYSSRFSAKAGLVQCKQMTDDRLRQITMEHLNFSGYSWKKNQYGLAIDNIVSYELVKPNRKVVKVTEKSDSSLFFGLKVMFSLPNLNVEHSLTLKPD